MRGRPRLLVVALCMSVAVVVGGCGGSSATPLPTLPPVTEPPLATESPAVETLAPQTEPPAATAKPTQKPSTEGTRYRIKKGDTLWAIANKYGVTVKALTKANPGIKPNALKVGQVIIIPPK